MKKLLIVFLFFMSANISNAFENRFIFAIEPVVKIKSSDESIASVKEFYTIMNEKNTYILEPKKCGEVVLDVQLKDSLEKIYVKITEEKTEIKPNTKFDFVEVDVVPEYIEYDKPPMLYREDVYSKKEISKDTDKDADNDEEIRLRGE